MRRFSPQLRDLSWLVERPITHRGLHDFAHGIVENAESAFAASIRHGYAIECDIQLSADGQAMVFHDSTLDRVMDGHGDVNRHSLKQLKSMRYKVGNDRIQTLTELLEQVQGRVPLVIELKTHWDGDLALAQKAVAGLARYTGPYGLMSFDPVLVAALAELSPQTARGIVAERVIDPSYRVLPVEERLRLRHLAHLEQTRPHFVSYNWHDLPYAPVQIIRAQGFPVITWTIHSAAEAALARRYCDQITFEGFFA
jgi:glycerophosphoryl diester phosphodiesterase